MFYKVIYEIELDAENPMDAALEVEKILLNMDGKNAFRPILKVENVDSGEKEIIDLFVEG